MSAGLLVYNLPIIFFFFAVNVHFILFIFIFCNRVSKSGQQQFFPNPNGSSRLQECLNGSLLSQILIGYFILNLTNGNIRLVIVICFLD